MAVWMSTVTAVAGMVFSRMLNNARVMERQCRAGTNGANVSGRIRGIRAERNRDLENAMPLQGTI